MVDLNYIAAPWIQEDRGDGLCWYPPPDTVGSFDMRGKEQPFGFFCVSKLPSSGFDYTLLGKGDIRGSIEISTSIRAFWREFLGLTIEEMPDSISQLSEMLIKTFYYHGDPEGVKRFCPPTITSKGKLEFFLNGHARPGATFDKNMLHRRKFTGKNDPAWPVIQRHYQNIYQKWVDEDEPARFKVLSVWERELGVPAKDFQPFGINEKAIKPETSISDDFSSQGNSDLEDDADWDQVDGSYIIVSEEVQIDGDIGGYPNAYRNTNALSSVNHRAQIKQVNQPSVNGGHARGHWGPAIRFAAAAETFYHAQVREDGNDADVLKVVAGSITPINTDTWTPSWPNIVKLQADGATLKLFIDGSEESSFTYSDVDVDSGIRCGIISHLISNMGTASCDDFEAADLAAGGETVVIGKASLTSIGRAVNPNAETVLGISKGSLTSTGKALNINQAMVIQLARATMSHLGKVISVNDTVVLGKGAMTATGRSVIANIPRSVQIAKAALVATGKVLKSNTVVAIGKAALSMVGKSFSIAEEALRRRSSWLLYRTLRRR